MENAAKAQMTLANGISVNVYLTEAVNSYLVWFEPSYDREEYEEYGLEKDWDETNHYCEESKRKPLTTKSLNLINRKLAEINKYKDGTGFCKKNGKIYALGSGLVG